MAQSHAAGGPAFDAPELEDLKRRLVTACHVLDNEGITDGYGHLSVRVPGAEAFITIARVSPRLADLDHLIMMDYDGRYLGGRDTPPFEWPIHARVLKARPDMESVCHTHSVWSAVFSILPVKLRPVHHYGTFLPPAGVPLYEPPGLIRTVEQGDALAQALGQENAVLLRGHGDTIVGTSIEDTAQKTIRMARNGEIAHLALLHSDLGEPRSLSDEDIRAFEEGGRHPARGWDYYLSRLSGLR
jgi:ribulose-5-phosphate 4-epimerase/fuculose-1-phosphate aldolase